MSEVVFECDYDPELHEKFIKDLKPVEEKWGFWESLIERWRWKRRSRFDTSLSWFKVGLVNFLSLVVIYLLVRGMRDA